MSEIDFLVDVIIAVGVGGLVGLERETRRDNRLVVAGVRTFPLVALTGLLLEHLRRAMGGDALIVAAGLVVVALFAMALFLVRHRLGVTGLTTPVAMVVTYLAGVLIGSGLRLEGVVVGVGTTFLLLTKDRLHGVARHLEESEVMGALQFITLAFILFPLVPDRTVDPWGLFNPHWLLLIVLFVSSLSFVSLLAMRAVGPQRGLESSGLLGGLANSEAATASIGNLALAKPSLASHAAAGVVLATGTMLVRNLAVAAFADPSLMVLRGMLPVLVPMTIAAGAATVFMRRPAERQEAESLDVRNPFAVLPAMRFALVFAVVSGLAFLARESLGEWGVYVMSLGSFVSAGAVIASVASLAVAGKVTVATAADTAILACVLGVLNKFVILRAVNPALLRRVAAPLGATGIVGIVMLAAVIALRTTAGI